MMRDFKGIKRQRGRNRNGGGGGGSSGGGGGKSQQNVNRAFDSNGPDNVKIRGHAQHVFEKYQQLARDAFSSGDRVLAENYLQHADHYFRVLRTLQPQRPASEILGRDVFASGLDIDFEDDDGFDDGETDGGSGETNGGDPGRSDSRNETRQDGGRQESGRQDGGRSDYGARQDQSRQDGPRQDGGRWEPRRDDRYDNRAREERFEPRRDSQDVRTEPRRDERAEFRRDAQQGAQREEARRDNPEVRRDERSDGRSETRTDARQGQESREGRRDGRNRRDRDTRNDPRELRFEPQAQDGQRLDTTRSDSNSEGDRARDPPPMIESTPLAGAEPSPMLRSEDGGVSEAPAFLQTATVGEEAADARRPRAPRRRRPRSFEGGADGDLLTAPPPARTSEEV